MSKLIQSDQGVLTFEWILLVTILVIGVIAGLSALRDTLTVELADVSQAAGHANQSFSYAQLKTNIDHGDGEGSFRDIAEVKGGETIDMASITTVSATPATTTVYDTGGNPLQSSRALVQANNE